MIAFLSVFPPYRGGISTFSDYTFRWLDQSAEIKAYNFFRLYPDLFFPGKSQKVEFDESTIYAEPILHSYNPFNWKKVARTILADDPECLLYSYWHPFFAPAYTKVIKTLKKKKPDLKVIAIAHNVLPHEAFPLQEYLVNKLFSYTDEIVLLSSQTEMELHSFTGDIQATRLFHPVYIQNYPTEPKEDLREKYGFEPDDHILIFFGLVRPYKGLDIFIEALNDLPLKELKIRPLIVGEFYTDKQHLLNKIDTSSLDQYMVIDRFVSDRVAAELLYISDAMVLPYRSASQSGVLSNAINFDLPVIVSDLPGLSEHLSHKESGLIFDTGNPDALKQQIKYFVTEKVKQPMSQEISKLKDELSWQKFAGKLLSLIEK